MNIYIQIRSSEKSKSLTFFSTALKVQTIENYG